MGELPTQPPDRTPHPKIIHPADKDEAMVDQLHYLISVHWDHNTNTLCYCTDCSSYARVSAELLSKFEVTTDAPERVGKAKKAKPG